MKILTQQSSPTEITRLAGNKAASLYRLSNSTVAVPRWVVLGSDLFGAFCQHHQLDRQLAEWFNAFDSHQATDLAQMIERTIVDLPLTPEMVVLVEEAIDHVGAGPLAIRSSSIEEDSAEFSFAGQFDSFLNIEGLEPVIDHLRRCWASAWSARSLLYRQRHNLPLQSNSMAVIIQRMVVAEKSGVLFTVHPTSGDTNQMVISALYGLGEALVSGAVDGDTITVDRQQKKVVEQLIGEKEQRLDGLTMSEVPAHLRDRLSLEREEINRLIELGEQLEKQFGAPQDIEWSIAKGEVWVLQSRPVTTAPAPLSDDFQLWDNSNIVENYPGIVLPLTFSFSLRIYSTVFRNFCQQQLGIPAKQLKQMDGFLGSVLAHLNGQFYYNLLHWYKLSGLTPFQSLSRTMMEVQMGVGEKLDLVGFAERISPYSTDSRLEHIAIRTRVTAGFIWCFLRLERNVAQFKRFFYSVFDHYNGLDYESMPAQTVWHHYQQFESRLLARWGMMIALESAIGLSYGILRIMIRRWLIEVPAWFEVAVIGGVTSIESLEPARRMAELAEYARSRPSLEKMIVDETSEQLFTRLKEADEVDFIEQINRYIDQFGYRCSNELKLESPDLRQAPELLFDMLKTAIATAPTQSGSKAGAQEEALQTLLNHQLNRWQRTLFGFARRRAHSAINARETVRFCRSRFFGVVRRMFYAIGCGLVKEGLLEQPRDIFYLRVDEIGGCFDATLADRRLAPLIASRKADFTAYQAMEPLPPRFVTHGSVTAWLNQPANLAALHARHNHTANSDDTLLRGTPCSPGRVEGEAQVVSEPTEFSGGILVTYRTDPGWVPIFSAASAILVERGSPLAHAAIVAREIGVPTIVQIPGLTKQLRTGMKLSVDGGAGTIEIIPEVS